MPPLNAALAASKGLTMKNTRTFRLGLALVVTLALGACSSMSPREQSRLTGQVIGGATGAALGSLIGGGTGRAIATGAGIMLGTIIGGEVADKD